MPVRGFPAHHGFHSNLRPTYPVLQGGGQGWTIPSKKSAEISMSGFPRFWGFYRVLGRSSAMRVQNTTKIFLQKNRLGKFLQKNLTDCFSFLFYI
jgi:hypothetical protein